VQKGDLDVTVHVTISTSMDILDEGLILHKNIITSFNGQIHNKWAIAFLIHHNFVS
jgi:hypothetical protein